MEGVLIVSSNEKGTALLVSLIREEHPEQITSAENGAEARRMLLNNDYDLVIINCPLTDEFGHELAEYVAESTSASCIMIVKAEMADQVSAKVEDYGVMVVQKPVSKTLFFQAVKLISASRKRLAGLRNENARLQEKIEEIRLIDRAKCALIQYLSLTEQQAHRQIEKQAMDLRLTKREVALRIIKTYE